MTGPDIPAAPASSLTIAPSSTKLVQNTLVPATTHARRSVRRRDAGGLGGPELLTRVQAEPPGHVVHTLRALADARDEDPGELEARIEANAAAAFRLPEPCASPLRGP